MVRGREDGFTLPELIVVTVGFVLLCGIAALLLAPSTTLTERLDAERQLEVAQLAQEVNAYIAATGELPPYVPTKPTSIGTADEEYDMCLALGLTKVPLDPQTGARMNEAGETVAGGAMSCEDTEVAYSAGYRIAQRDDGRIVISATLADGTSFELRSRKP